VRTDPTLFLSRLLGRSVRDSSGVRVGRMTDLTVIYDIAHPIVHRLSIRRGRVHYLLPWRLVQSYDDEVRLSVDETPLSAYASQPIPTLEDRELLLARDVLDTQVVDLAGRRLSRVSDVILVPGSGGPMEVAAVDLGAGSLLRRQRLLEAAPPALARLLAELHAAPHPSRRQLRTSGWRVRRPSTTVPPPVTRHNSQ
jgi:sporulation protein YlmC with PRC-barrel domain